MSIKINKDRCKGCQLCVSACPYLYIVKSKDKNGNNTVEVNKEIKCAECGNCYLVCPDMAIEIQE